MLLAKSFSLLTREKERERELLRGLAVASFPSAFGPELFFVVLYSVCPQLKFCGMNVIRCFLLKRVVKILQRLEKSK